ncbi:MAG: hypothetical protein IIX10_05655, partial [Clostridia bacterium]|nr:hypothetical protein [Clostridia bacterium]
MTNTTKRLIAFLMAAIMLLSPLENLPGALQASRAYAQEVTSGETVPGDSALPENGNEGGGSSGSATIPDGDGSSATPEPQQPTAEVPSATPELPQTT